MAGQTQVFRPFWIALLLSANCWLSILGDRSVSPDAPSPGDSASLIKGRSFDPGAKPHIAQQDDEDFDEDDDLEDEFGQQAQDQRPDSSHFFGGSSTPEQEAPSPAVVPPPVGTDEAPLTDDGGSGNTIEVAPSPAMPPPVETDGAPLTNDGGGGNTIEGQDEDTDREAPLTNDGGGGNTIEAVPSPVMPSPVEMEGASLDNDGGGGNTIEGQDEDTDHEASLTNDGGGGNTIEGQDGGDDPGAHQDLAAAASDERAAPSPAELLAAPSPATLLAAPSPAAAAGTNGMPENDEDLEDVAPSPAMLAGIATPAVTAATDFNAASNMPNFYSGSIGLGERYHKAIDRASKQVAGTQAAASSLLSHSQRYESSLEQLSVNLQAFNVGVKNFREMTAKKHEDNTRNLADSLQKGLQNGIDAWPRLNTNDQ